MPQTDANVHSALDPGINMTKTVTFNLLNPGSTFIRDRLSTEGPEIRQQRVILPTTIGPPTFGHLAYEFLLPALLGGYGLGPQSAA